MTKCSVKASFPQFSSQNRDIAVNLLFMRKLFFSFIFSLLVFGCKQKGHVGRFIAPQDTQFSTNIRNISAKINEDPSNAKLYYDRAMIFYNQVKYKDASWDFKTATVFDSSNAVYHYRYADALLHLDTVNSLEILLSLRKSIALQPKFSEAEITLAKFLIARQEYKEAESILKVLSAREPALDAPYILLAISRKEQKDTSGALAWLEKGLSYNPDNIDAVLQIAGLYRDKDPKLAVQYYDRALKTNDLNYEALYEKALLLQKQERYADAITLYDKVILVNPGHRLSYYNSAFIYALFKEYDKAMEKLNKLLDQDGNFAKAYALRGEIHAMKGNKKAARDDYQTALDLDPKNEMALSGLKAL